MSATSDYEHDLKTRTPAWVYLPQLPGNTELGPKVKGRPGGRTVNTATTRSLHELAPAAVQIEQGFAQAIFAAQVAAAPVEIGIGSAVENIAAATGLDHGVPGVIAKALGISPAVLLIIAIIFAYAVARQYRLVPPLKEL